MIYWDIDDVVADFAGAASEHTGSNYKIGDTITTADWAYIRKYHQRIFRDLDVNDKIRDLILRLEVNHSQAFLTAIPYDDNHIWHYAASDKFDWVRSNLFGIPMFIGPYAHDKWKHCSPGDILIDDRQSNVDDWKGAGGIAHLYRDYDSCVIFLKENGILYE